MQAQEAHRTARERGPGGDLSPDSELSPADSAGPPASHLSRADQLRAVGGAIVQQVDFTVNDTMIGGALPPEVGPAIKIGRTAAELYGQRELVAEDVGEAVRRGHIAAHHVKEELTQKGLEVGEAMGRAVQQVAGTPLDPLTEMQLQAARKHAERLEREAARERQALAGPPASRQA